MGRFNVTCGVCGTYYTRQTGHECPPVLTRWRSLPGGLALLACAGCGDQQTVTTNLFGRVWQKCSACGHLIHMLLTPWARPGSALSYTEVPLARCVTFRPAAELFPVDDRPALRHVITLDAVPLAFAGPLCVYDPDTRLIIGRVRRVASLPRQALLGHHSAAFNSELAAIDAECLEREALAKEALEAPCHAWAFVVTDATLFDAPVTCQPGSGPCWPYQAAVRRQTRRTWAARRR